MTRIEIDRLAASGASMPPAFTGIWKGQHYYKGQKWAGPSNMVGHGTRFVLTDSGLVPA